MKYFIILIIFVFIFSCSDDGSSKCDNIVCDSWKACNQNDGLCKLKPDRCESTETCSDGKVCTTQHICVNLNNPCDGISCSNHGQCYAHDGNPVCACERGYSPSSIDGIDCIPTKYVCKGSFVNYDVDGDGTNESYFSPTEDECFMFEQINYTRATHDDEGTPECHTPLMYSVEWSAHARNHSKQMFEAGNLFHADYPNGQNCAYGCGVECEMNMYMNGANEPHCGELSHHCNIMRCWGSSYVGIGYYNGSWNTQNFY